MYTALAAADAHLSSRLAGMLSFEANPTPSPRYGQLVEVRAARMRTQTHAHGQTLT